MNGLKYIIVLFSIFINQLVLSQNLTFVDSLKFVFDQTTKEKTKQDVSLQIARYLRYTDYKKEALKYTKIAISLGEKSDNPQTILLGTKTLADIYEHHGEIKKSIAYHEICLKQAEVYKDTSFLSLIHGDMAYTYTGQGIYHKAIDHTLSGLALAKAVNDSSSIFQSYSFLCDYSLESGDTAEALNYANKALDIALKTKRNKLIYYGRKNLGQLYRLKGKNKQSLQELYASLNIVRKIDNEISLANICQQLSLTHWQLMEPDSALFYNRLSLKIWDKYGQNSSMVDGLLLRAKYYNTVFQYEKANKIKNSVDKYMNYEMSNSQLVNYYETFANSYAGLKRNNEAYKFLSKSKKIAKKIRNEQKSQYLADAQAKYETKEKALLLEKKELEIRQQKLLLWIVSSATVIFIILGVIALLAYASKRKANKLLAFQKTEIEKSNKEKEILLKEIHHRVKNNLQVISSLLNLQSNNISDSKAIAAIKEGRNRVKSIALIHQKLYQHEDISEINFQEYVEQLTSFLNATFKLKGKNISINVSVDNLFLDIDTAVPLGLIINELVSNSIKYAFEGMEWGEIMITLEKEINGKLILIIQDTGIGLPEGLNFEESQTLGLKLVRMLSMQLGGNVTYRHKKGSIFEIIFLETHLRNETA